MVLSLERAYADPLAPLMPHLEDKTATYAVLLTRDLETGRYRATVPDLPGFKCEAETPAEAKAIIRDAVTAWMHTMHSSGKDVPRPLDHSLETIEVGTEPIYPEERNAAQQFGEFVAKVCGLTEEARREYLVAEAAVLDERFPDATRHVEWSIDLLMQARAMLSNHQPHGELERVYKLLQYGLAQCIQGARIGLQGTCSHDIECMKRAEELYVEGMKATNTGLAELKRFAEQGH